MIPQITLHVQRRFKSFVTQVCCLHVRDSCDVALPSWPAFWFEIRLVSEPTSAFARLQWKRRHRIPISSSPPRKLGLIPNERPVFEVHKSSKTESANCIIRWSLDERVRTDVKSHDCWLVTCRQNETCEEKLTRFWQYCMLAPSIHAIGLPSWRFYARVLHRARPQCCGVWWVKRLSDMTHMTATCRRTRREDCLLRRDTTARCFFNVFLWCRYFWCWHNNFISR